MLAAHATSSFQKKVIDESKVVAFTQATAKKSKKQREEEAAEAKRRQHELETTQVFEEYVADFAATPRPRNALGFVKAGESAPVKVAKSLGFEEDTAMVSVVPSCEAGAGLTRKRRN